MTKQYTPHPWAEVIKAWADGKPVQQKPKSSVHWHIMPVDLEYSPRWYTDGTYEYRIKPATKKYRLALFDDDAGGGKRVAAINTELVAAKCSGYPTFVRWLTDWVEYEV